MLVFWGCWNFGKPSLEWRVSRIPGTCYCRRDPTDTVIQVCIEERETCSFFASCQIVTVLSLKELETSMLGLERVTAEANQPKRTCPRSVSWLWMITPVANRFGKSWVAAWKMNSKFKFEFETHLCRRWIILSFSLGSVGVAHWNARNRTTLWKCRWWIILSFSLW